MKEWMNDNCHPSSSSGLGYDEGKGAFFLCSGRPNSLTAPPLHSLFHFLRPSQSSRFSATTGGGVAITECGMLLSQKDNWKRHWTHGWRVTVFKLVSFSKLTFAGFLGCVVHIFAIGLPPNFCPTCRDQRSNITLYTLFCLWGKMWVSMSRWLG